MKASGGILGKNASSKTMLKLIAHRGLWSADLASNSLEALLAAACRGFGIETDIRDAGGEVVISHDVVVGSPFRLRGFLEALRDRALSPVLALNIKSDGLQTRLQALLKEFNYKNYYVFDFSVPDGVEYMRRGFPYFSRHSDLEPTPSLYTQSRGVWLDELEAPWVSQEDILSHASKRKTVCLVSPELHRREPGTLWSLVREILHENPSVDLQLCTDFPEKAASYFEGFLFKEDRIENIEA